MRSHIKFAGTLLALALGTASGADVGDQVPAAELQDAAGTSHRLDASLRRIYVTADRNGAALMKAAMANLDQGTLDAQHAAIIAQIGAAPFFVKALIRSSLKELHYKNWLDSDGSTESWLPHRADQVAVIGIEQRRITSIRYFGDATLLRQELADPNPARTGTTREN